MNTRMGYEPKFHLTVDLNSVKQLDYDELRRAY